jgi:hypothetical protein
MSTYKADENGVLNNFPIETKERLAEPPSKQQQIQYAIAAGIAAVFVGGMVWIATVVS